MTAAAPLYRFRCQDCGAAVLVTKPVAPEHRICDDCGHQRAHEALYGDSECKGCGRVLVEEDEWRAGLCRACDGVAHLYAEEDEDELRSNYCRLCDGGGWIEEAAEDEDDE